MVGRAKSKVREYDLLEMLLVCPDGDRQNPGDGILRLLGMLIGSEQDAETRKAVLSEEFGISLSKELSDEMDEMSDMSKGILEHGLEMGERVGFERGQREGFLHGEREGFERGEREGIERGRLEGRERGEREGFDRAVITHVKRLIDGAGMSADEAMETLGIACEDRRRYLDLL